MNNKISLTLLSLLLSLLIVPSVYSQGVQKKAGIPSDPKGNVERNLGTISSSTFRVRERVQLNATSSTSTMNRAKATSTNNRGGLAEEHRSEVSKFVQTLLDNADRTGGIGQQVRVIAREQASTSSTTTDAIEKIEKRSGLKTFLIGSDYENIGKLRSEMVQTRNRIEQLKGELSRVSTSTDKIVLEEEIKNMEQLQNRLQDFVTDNENKFSLFGWVVRMFGK
jgi:uncharacterized protein YaaQ